MSILMPLAFLSAKPTFWLLMMFLMWAAFAAMNVMIFMKSKGLGNMLMMGGGGCISLAYFIMLISDSWSAFVFQWLPFIGTAGILVGFFFAMRSKFAAQLAAMKAKLGDLASNDGDGDDD